MGLRVFAVALVLLALPVPSASAQSFLESLFGFSAPSSSRSHGRTRSRRAPREYSRERPSQQVRAYYNAPQHYGRASSGAGGTYRTYCVRMCDGFYFPIAYATSSRNLSRDAQKCSASCEGARLFYHGTGGEPEEMIDLHGKPYTSYPIAFKHRTELVKGCQCRPAPWTEAELERHRAYAAKLKPARAQSKIPGRSSRGAGVSGGSAGKSVVVPAANGMTPLPAEPVQQPSAETGPPIMHAP